VQKVLVEEAASVDRELYVGVVVDEAVRGPVVIASEAGGVEIEEVAARAPEKLLRLVLDPALGLQPFQGRHLAYALHLKPELVRPAVDLMMNLYRLFMDKDCSLAEVNPLVTTSDDRLLALDAKLNFDDNALFRHPEVQVLHDAAQEDPLEARASEKDISFVHLQGDVGCLVNGAGLAMATNDLVTAAGTLPANFLDVGGGADEEKVKEAVLIMLEDPGVKAVLVNIFGGILRCDVAARGIVAAYRQKPSTRIPIVARMLGTNMEEGRQVLESSGLTVIPVETLGQAVQQLRSQGGGKAA
jgi:succinyl-CoA synthetase beta subunit